MILYILRHAKSSWSEEGIKDIYRPLNRIGIKDAYHKAQVLRSKKVSIDLMVASPAFRAINTAIIIAKEINYPLDKVVMNSELYDASVKNIMKVVNGINNNISSLMLVGHNPGLTDFTNDIVKNGFEKIPTSGVVAIKFNSQDWRELGIGEIIYFDFSKS